MPAHLMSNGRKNLMQKTSALRTLCCAAIILISAGTANAQFGGFKLPGAPKIPGVGVPGMDRLFGKEDLITSNFGDATTPVVFLDDYDPKPDVSMVALPQGRDGVFHLFPGAVFDFEGQSYCLHAGTYGPGHGEGYLYAPLKGSGTGIITHILTNSVQHPDIPQQDIQVLVWAILAHTRISDMPAEMQRTAAQLLSPAEILRLNGLALDALTDKARDEALNRVTGPLRDVLSAENNLRQMLTGAVAAPYEQLERVAVLPGDPPDNGPKGPEIPRGRWSYLPENGCFVRYFPNGYSDTYCQVSVPGRHTLERDAQGRISRIANAAGESIEITYDDMAPPVLFSGRSDSSARGWALKSVKFLQSGVGAKPAGEPVEATWQNTGWTLVGPLPAKGQGQMPADATRFDGFQDRVVDSRRVWGETAALLKRYGVPEADASRTDSDVRNLEDLMYIHAALLPIYKEQQQKQPWLSDEAAIVDTAWQEAFSRAVRRRNPRQAARETSRAAYSSRLSGYHLAADDGGSGGGGAGFGSGGGAAMPADQNRQRLAQSSRPRGPQSKNPGDTPFGPPIQSALKDHNIPPQDVSAKDDHHYFVRLGHGDNHALPTQSGIENSNPAPGSQEGAKSLMIVSVYQTETQTRVNVRTVDVETGVVTAAGQGTTNGTDPTAVTAATNQAVNNAGVSIGGGNP